MHSYNQKAYSANTHQVGDVLTIYPFWSSEIKLNCDETVVRSAIRLAMRYQNSRPFSEFLLYLSAIVQEGKTPMTLLVDSFEEGDPTTNRCLISSKPDKLRTPLFVSKQPAILAEKSSVKLNDNLVNLNYPVDFYRSAIKHLTTYFLNDCHAFESLCRAMFINSTIVFDDMPGTINLGVSFDMISLANVFKATCMNPLSIVDTSLSQSVENDQSYYPKFQTGFCHFFKNKSVLMLNEDEGYSKNIPLIGIWISGVSGIHHPFVWISCIRYAFSSFIGKKSNYLDEDFLLLLFHKGKPTEFYRCTSLGSQLEFKLFSGIFNRKISDSMSENDYLPVDLVELKEGYRFKVFSECLTKPQDILYQHKMLENPMPPKEQIAFHASMTKSAAKPIPNGADSHFSDNEIEPRPLSGSLLAPSSKFETFGSINNPNLVVGSYHSVSDISILSDNDPNEHYINGRNDKFSYKPASTKSSNESLGNPKPLRRSGEFEHANPLSRRSTEVLALSQNNLNGSAGAMPISNMQTKYNKNFYSSNNNSLSSSSSSHSQHSPHDFPGMKHPQAPLHAAPPVVYNHMQSGNQAASEPTFKPPYDFNGISDSSQSMLFGIPRNSPMPIAPSISEELKPLTLDSPDLTKFDESQFFPPQPFQTHNRPSSETSSVASLVTGSHGDIRKPILKKPTAIETTPVALHDNSTDPLALSMSSIPSRNQNNLFMRRCDSLNSQMNHEKNFVRSDSVHTPDHHFKGAVGSNLRDDKESYFNMVHNKSQPQFPSKDKDLNFGHPSEMSAKSISRLSTEKRLDHVAPQDQEPGNLLHNSDYFKQQPRLSAGKVHYTGSEQNTPTIPSTGSNTTTPFYHHPSSHQFLANPSPLSQPSQFQPSHLQQHQPIPQQQMILPQPQVQPPHLGPQFQAQPSHLQSYKQQLQPIPPSHPIGLALPIVPAHTAGSSHPMPQPFPQHNMPKPQFQPTLPIPSVLSPQIQFTPNPFTAAYSEAPTPLISQQQPLQPALPGPYQSSGPPPQQFLSNPQQYPHAMPPPLNAPVEPVTPDPKKLIQSQHLPQQSYNSMAYAQAKGASLNNSSSSSSSNQSGSFLPHQSLQQPTQAPPRVPYQANFTNSSVGSSHEFKDESTAKAGAHHFGMAPVLAAPSFTPINNRDLMTGQNHGKKSVESSYANDYEISRISSTMIDNPMSYNGSSYNMTSACLSMNQPTILAGASSLANHSSNGPFQTANDQFLNGGFKKPAEPNGILKKNDLGPPVEKAYDSNFTSQSSKPSNVSFAKFPISKEYAVDDSVNYTYLGDNNNTVSENVFEKALKKLDKLDLDLESVSSNGTSMYNNDTTMSNLNFISMQVDDITKFELDQKAKMLEKKYPSNKYNHEAYQYSTLHENTAMNHFSDKHSANRAGSDDDDDDDSAKSDDNEEDLWLFKKPEMPKRDQFQRRSHDGCRAESIPTNSASGKDYYPPKMVASNGRIKNFSDEDDEDENADETNILDIERLKRMPKLL